MHKYFLIAGGAFALLAVVIGAFGAHAFDQILTVYNRVSTFETGVRYHMFHSLALIFINGIDMKTRSRALHIASGLFIAGIILFSGSLYTLSLTNQTMFGVITPVGGLCFIFGWAFFIYAVSKKS